MCDGDFRVGRKAEVWAWGRCDGGRGGKKTEGKERVVLLCSNLRAQALCSRYLSFEVAEVVHGILQALVVTGYYGTQDITGQQELALYVEYFSSHQYGPVANAGCSSV